MEAEAVKEKINGSGSGSGSDKKLPLPDTLGARIEWHWHHGEVFHGEFIGGEGGERLFLYFYLLRSESSAMTLIFRCVLESI